MRCLIITIGMLSCISCSCQLGVCLAQESGGNRKLETDRDSFTPAVTTVEGQRLMVESAWSYIDNRDVPDTHSLPELLLRYGLTDSIELRFGSNYEIGGETNEIAGGGAFSGGRDATTGSGDLEEEVRVSYGIKGLLTTQSGWLPQCSAILTGSTPTSGSETATDVISTLVAGWELSNEWSLAGSIRHRTSVFEGDHFNSWAPSSVLKIPLNEKLNIHAEYFGIFTDGRDAEFVKHFVSPGVHYLITPDLEVGIRTGWGLNDQSANFFSNVGFGWLY